MTNTAITDPEVLEARYPVRLERFSLRAESGGAGRYRGGDGLVREIRFLEPLELSLLSQHRRSGPYGRRGGAAGKAGEQRVIRSSGERLVLESLSDCDVDTGDLLILKTPGGGGWGKKGEG